MVTMSDIARRIGVSVATVSRVLSGGDSPVAIGPETRSRVLAAARELGYQPNLFARSLRTRRSSFIAAVIWNILDPYFSEILSGVQQVIGRTGNHLIVDSAGGEIANVASSVEWVSRVRPAGLLLIGGPLIDADRDNLRALSAHTPTVLIGTRATDNSLPSVAVDNYRTGVIGARYCLGRAHRTFHFLTFAERTADEEDRLAGVLSVLDQSSETAAHAIVETERGVGASHDVALDIMNSEAGPFSFFLNDDQTALGVLRAAFDAGLSVPGEVSILGCDNLEIGSFTHPRLSTVVQPRHELGARGAELLLEQMGGDSGGGEGADGEDAARQVTLMPSLLIRESSS